MMRHTVGVKSGAKVACSGMLAVLVLCTLVFTSAASAAEGPQWRITATTEPTHVVPGGEARLTITATNVGGAATSGPIAITDTLGAGLTVKETLRNPVGFDAFGSGQAFDGESQELRAPLECKYTPVVQCAYERAVDTGDQLVMTVTFSAASAKDGESIANLASVSGGGAQLASASTPIVIGSTPALFGPAPESVVAALSTMQAGAHPDLTTEFTLDTSKSYGVSADTKDVRFNLPPGLVGSAVGLPRCTVQKVVEEKEHPGLCPSDSMVGVVTVGLEEHSRGLETFVTPIYNIAPNPGEPAAFAFDAVILPVRLDTSVLTDGNDSISVTAPDIPESAETIFNAVTVWGVPAEHSGPGNDLTAIQVNIHGRTFGDPDPGQSPIPLLTNPQQCTEPLEGVMSADPWEEPGTFVSENAPMGTMSGCGLVPFSTGLNVLPDAFEAGEPAGYQFNVTVPQHNEPGVLATSSVKNTVVKLPEGVVVNPSAAWGLQSCSNSQFYGAAGAPGHLVQEPAEEEECPNASKVGEVEVHSPDLEVPLKGSVYLGSPECDPCTPQDAAEGKMARLLMQLVVEREPGVHILEDQPNVFVKHGEGGVIVKLEGRTKINQATGQITAELDNTPQLPFSEFKLVLEGGPRAVLANPRSCGPTVARTEADFTPWSTGPGVSDSTPSYEFVVEGCDGHQFNPSFKAGMPNIQAGAFSEFTLAFGRSDQDQYLSGISTTMPPGLLGSLSGVELCKEAQANTGTCGPNSLIGTTEVLTGPGADPFLVSGGQVFLTEGYGGAPFGLSIVVPAVAGPYTLTGLNGNGEPGNGKVVVRAKIVINPSTAVLSVVSNKLPTMLDGIPLQLRAVNVRINRPGFTFNPTSCNKMALTGTLASAEGMSANVSSSFQVTNCANLKFEPKFAVSTSGKTSKADGASLTAKLSYPNVPAGTDTNISKVKVELPVQLPSRLTTLQKACTNAQFETNPAGCPSASMIGHAKVITPLVPVPLEGPAIFVSHGGEAFPSLTMVLQGYGVTVDLVGTTFISKAGITSTTFNTVPDVPFNTFELTLPQGPYSALAANGNLCALTKTVTVKKKVTVRVKGHKKTMTRSVKATQSATLSMPTEFVAQNGTAIHETTKVSVTSCTKTGPVKQAKKGAKAKHGKKK